MRRINSKIIELLGPRQLVVTEGVIDLQNIKANEVAARTIYSAISPGTEVAAYNGDPPLRPGKTYPRIVGYCNVAAIIAKGSEVNDYKIGDKVLTFQSHRSAFVCRADEVLIKLDTRSDLKQAATTYLFHLGYDALLKAQARPGHNIAVIGLGTLGITTLAVAALYSSQTYGFSNQKMGAGLAHKLGASQIFRKDNEQYVRAINKRTHGIGIDLVINTSNNWADWQLALKLCRKGGTIVSLGFPGRTQPVPDFNPLDPQYFYDKQLTLAACGYTPNYDVKPCDLRFTVKRNLIYLNELIQGGKLPAAELISKEVPWDRLEQIYKDYSARRLPMYTCILRWRQDQ